MIDLYDIEIHNIPLGPNEWARLPGHCSRRRPVNRMQVDLKDPSWPTKQDALILIDSFRLICCPQKALGRWNCVGTDDLREAVLRTAPSLLHKMGVRVTPEIMESLAEGEYDIRKVHIAHQFWLPDNDITDFLLATRRRLNESHGPVPVFRGDGFMIGNRSRTVEYVFYDKLREFLKSALAFYQAQMERHRDRSSFAKVAVGLDRDLQRIAAAAGPRLEMRLGDHFFRRNPRLKKGKGWTPTTADSLYHGYLRKLKLPAVVEAVPARVQARQRLKTAYKTYLLWARGEPLNDIGTNVKTIASHRKLIEDALGVDIRTPASAVLGDRGTVDVRAVFDWSNRVRADAIDIDRLGWLGDPYKPFR